MVWITMDEWIVDAWKVLVPSGRSYIGFLVAVTVIMYNYCDCKMMLL